MIPKTTCSISTNDQDRSRFWKEAQSLSNEPVENWKDIKKISNRDWFRNWSTCAEPMPPLKKINIYCVQETGRKSSASWSTPSVNWLCCDTESQHQSIELHPRVRRCRNLPLLGWSPNQLTAKGLLWQGLCSITPCIDFCKVWCMEKGISGIARQSSQGPPELFSFLLTFHLDFVSFLKDCAFLFVQASQYFQCPSKTDSQRLAPDFGYSLKAWASKSS